MQDVIEVTADGPVRIVRLNRPAELNAVNGVLHRRLVDVWRELERDEEARAVVLTGAGRAFSAGGDFAFMQAMHRSQTARDRIQREARQILTTMIEFPLPVVAAVNGPAVGLGTSLALSCDIVYLAETAFLADPHVGIGLTAGDGGAVLWPLHTSLLRAKEYLFTGDRVPADEALRLGLANRVCPTDRVLDDALALARRLADQPARALQATKRALAMHAQRAAVGIADYAATAELVDIGSTDHVEKVRAAMGSEAYDALARSEVGR